MLTRFKTERSAGAMAGNENDATQRKCIHVVEIALQSWCLIKLSRGLLLRNFDLAFETVINGAFVRLSEGD